MKFSTEEYEKIVLGNTLPKDQTGFIVLLGGKMFKSRSGKSLFRERRYALSSLCNSLKWGVRGIVREKLMTLGMTNKEISDDSEYLRSWENFVKQATADGFLQIVELK